MSFNMEAWGRRSAQFWHDRNVERRAERARQRANVRTFVQANANVQHAHVRMRIWDYAGFDLVGVAAEALNE